MPTSGFSTGKPEVAHKLSFVMVFSGHHLDDIRAAYVVIYAAAVGKSAARAAGGGRFAAAAEGNDGLTRGRHKLIAGPWSEGLEGLSATRGRDSTSRSNEF